MGKFCGSSGLQPARPDPVSALHRPRSRELQGERGWTNHQLPWTAGAGWVFAGGAVQPGRSRLRGRCLARGCWRRSKVPAGRRPTPAAGLSDPSAPWGKRALNVGDDRGHAWLLWLVPEQSAGAGGSPARRQRLSVAEDLRRVGSVPAEDGVVDGALRLLAALARASVGDADEAGGRAADASEVVAHLVALPGHVRGVLGESSPDTPGRPWSRRGAPTPRQPWSGQFAFSTCSTTASNALSVWPAIFAPYRPGAMSTSRPVATTAGAPTKLCSP